MYNLIICYLVTYFHIFISTYMYTQLHGKCLNMYLIWYRWCWDRYCLEIIYPHLLQIIKLYTYLSINKLLPAYFCSTGCLLLNARLIYISKTADRSRIKGYPVVMSLSILNYFRCTTSMFWRMAASCPRIFIPDGLGSCLD